jgi:hypothetical protein
VKKAIENGVHRVALILLRKLESGNPLPGKPFNPDARMRKILTDAAAGSNAAGRALNWRSSEYPGWSYYPGSMWANMLWQGGYTFETRPPMITSDGKFKPLPPTGAKTLDSRTSWASWTLTRTIWTVARRTR